MLAAVLALLAEDDWAGLTAAGVAQAAGVHPSTVYRRWGSVPVLVADALTDLWSRSSPLPDTGRLRDDVHAYAARVAADLHGPLGPTLLRGAVLIGGQTVAAGPGDRVRGRTEQIEDLLDRARARGEACASATDFFETVIGPLYGYALFAPVALPHRAPVLADRFLALPGA